MSGGAFAHRLGRKHKRHAGRLRLDLRLAGAFQVIDIDEGLGHRRTRGQQAVVAQDHGLVLAQAGHQAFAFFQVQRNALVVVITQPLVEAQRVLGNRQQPVALAGHGNAVCRMRMHHASQVVAGGVHRRMDGETRSVDHLAFGVARVHRVAVQVDLHQILRTHFVKQHAVAVDQEMMFVAGHPCADVGVDQVRHAEMRDQAVQRRQFFTHLCFACFLNHE
ncbi:hypothetical protein D3C73_1115280 [compost metagenome]